VSIFLAFFNCIFGRVESLLISPSQSALNPSIEPIGGGLFYHFCCGRKTLHQTVRS
jgi:hypothetical protein